MCDLSIERRQIKEMCVIGICNIVDGSPYKHLMHKKRFYECDVKGTYQDYGLFNKDKIDALTTI